MKPPSFTLTAGPGLMSDRVRGALAAQTVAHTDPFFHERFVNLERKLAHLLGTDHDVVLMQAEAIVGLEAGARGLTAPGTKWLNLVSGPYGAWFADWLHACGAEVVTHRVPYDESIDPADVERILDEHGDIECVAVVHCETPSGMQNPLEEISRAAHARGALTMSDSVAAFASAPLRVDDWHVDLCVVAGHKCLGATAGMSIVSVSPAAWEKMAANPNAPRGSFLSLLDWKERWIDAGRTSFLHDPSVAEVNAIDAAVDELIELGLETSIARHVRAAEATRAGVRAMGLTPWAREDRFAANCTTSVRCPEGVTPAQVVEHVRRRHGVMLSTGAGELAERLICLGHLGIAAGSLYPEVAVGALGRGLVELGVDVDLGAGVAAVAERMAEPVPTAPGG